jgi:hypothetical protein
MEHRWGHRKSTNVAVRFVAMPATIGTGRVINVSLTGAFLETQVPLRLLSLVYLEPFGEVGDSTASSKAYTRLNAVPYIRPDATLLRQF